MNSHDRHCLPEIGPLAASVLALANGRESQKPQKKLHGRRKTIREFVL
jgi:hypothetical protein